MLLMKNRTVEGRELAEAKGDVTETENSSGRFTRIKKIPRPPSLISSASMARSESLGRWRQNFGNKNKQIASSSGAKKEDRSRTVLVKKVQREDKP